MGKGPKWQDLRPQSCSQHPVEPSLGYSWDEDSSES